MIPKILSFLLVLVLLIAITMPTSAQACDAALGVCATAPNVNYLVQPVQQAYVSAAPVVQTVVQPVAVQNYAQAYSGCAALQQVYAQPVVQYQQQYIQQPVVQYQKQFVRQPVIVQRQKIRQPVVVQRQKIVQQAVAYQPVVQQQVVVKQRQRFIAPVAKFRARNQVQAAAVIY